MAILKFNCDCWFMAKNEEDPAHPIERAVTVVAVITFPSVVLAIFQSPIRTFLIRLTVMPRCHLYMKAVFPH